MHINHVKALVVGLVFAGAVWSQAAAPTSPQGVITAKVFLDIGGGTAVADLTGNAKFPDSPDITTYPTYFEAYATGDINTPPANDVYSNSGGQIVGYFYPPTTGDYIFYISSDDGGNLYLSPDSSSANKKLIAQEAGWSNPRNYTTVGGTSTVEDKCSQTFIATEWPTKDPAGGAKITLTANQPYYIEALFKEGGGGDNLSVSIDGVLPIAGTYLASFDKNSGPATITTPPQSQTVTEGGPVTFSVVADGTPPYTYQWRRGGSPIADATNSTYTISRVYRTDNGALFSVAVTGAQGAAAISANATLTVNSDNTPPTLVVARGSSAFTTVAVTFSEPLDLTTAQAPSNYQISGGITVSAATLGTAPNDNVVVLTTPKQAEASTYTVTVSNVKDVVGNTIAPNSTVDLKSFVFQAGAILHQKYDSVDDNTGSTPDNLFSDPRYPGGADRQDLESMMEYPPGGATRVAADPARNYFDTLEGYFIPPTTGNYVFLTAGADRWWLYLSTDDSPANRYMVAAEPGGWSDARGWTQMYSGSLENRRSDLSTLNAWPTAPTITLTAGRRYYMLEVHHDPSWCGADDFSATYIKEGEGDPANGSAPTLTGSVVGAYIDPTGAAVNITQQPVDTTAQAGKTAVFTVAATGTSAYGGTVSYQWQRMAPGGTTWTDIAGATTASYETPILLLADSGAKYQVVCSVPTVTVNSSVATLTVVSDAVPPQIAGAGAVPSQTGTTFDVGVTFNEVVDPVSAGNMANYTLSAGSISAIKYYPGSHGVVLTASGLTVGNTYTVTVTGVKDVSGNAMTATPKEFKVSAMKWGVVGGNELALGNGVLATAENGFDVYSDGIGEWATYDEATFVYEQVTGDFDKVLRVEYQDSSSQWARAGLIVRDVTNFGVDRAAQEGGEAGRYQKVHVNPKTTVMGTAGNNSWEGNRRLATGAATTTAGGSGTPLYPDAWCRLKRASNLFTIFRSDNGVSWTQLGTTTFDVPMPATVFVGPEFSPENANISPEDLRGVWLAKFRDYGNYNPVVTPTIGVSAAGVITYAGVLRSSATVNGTYAPVAGATSPYTVPKTGTAMFYRTSSQ